MTAPVMSRLVNAPPVTDMNTGDTMTQAPRITVRTLANLDWLSVSIAPLLSGTHCRVGIVNIQ